MGRLERAYCRVATSGRGPHPGSYASRGLLHRAVPHRQLLHQAVCRACGNNAHAPRGQSGHLHRAGQHRVLVLRHDRHIRGSEAILQGPRRQGGDRAGRHRYRSARPQVGGLDGARWRAAPACVRARLVACGEGGTRLGRGRGDYGAHGHERRRAHLYLQGLRSDQDREHPRNGLRAEGRRRQRQDGRCRNDGNAQHRSSHQDGWSRNDGNAQHRSSHQDVRY